jgi:hypothetical protein
MQCAMASQMATSPCLPAVKSDRALSPLVHPTHHTYTCRRAMRYAHAMCYITACHHTHMHWPYQSTICACMPYDAMQCVVLHIHMFQVAGSHRGFIFPIPVSISIPMHMHDVRLLVSSLFSVRLVPHNSQSSQRTTTATTTTHHVPVTCEFGVLRIATNNPKPKPK